MQVDIKVTPGTHASENAGLKKKNYYCFIYLSIYLFIIISYRFIIGSLITRVLTVNKQLNDKERVAAALENSQLLEVVTRCIANSDEE